MHDRTRETDVAAGRDDRGTSRRQVLRLATSAVVVGGIGSTTATADPASVHHERGAGVPSASALGTGCPDATVEPNVTHYDHSLHDVCSDTHPKTRELQYRVRTALESQYPTVGALIDDGFVPYFDFFVEDVVYSHWLNPEYVSDDGVVDPKRPESVLVDHEYWRPMGVMFVATPGGGRLDPPPSTYETRSGKCTPWHAHVGVPGRYAWAKYRAAYGEFEWPCRTPWMMHVWNYADEGVYAHHAPADRGGPPAEPAGFETDADPERDRLAPEHLPDALRERCEERWGDVATKWGDAWRKAWNDATDDEDDDGGWDLPWAIQGTAEVLR
jgi:hypothetical protein